MLLRWQQQQQWYCDNCSNYKDNENNDISYNNYDDKYSYDDDCNYNYENNHYYYYYYY